MDLWLSSVPPQFGEEADTVMTTCLNKASRILLPRFMDRHAEKHLTCLKSVHTGRLPRGTNFQC